MRQLLWLTSDGHILLKPDNIRLSDPGITRYYFGQLSGFYGESDGLTGDGSVWPTWLSERQVQLTEQSV